MRRLRRWIPAASCLEQVRETGGNSCDNIAVIANALAGRKCFSDIPAPSLIGATQKVGAFSQPKGNSKFDETAGFVVLASSEWFGILMCVCAFYIRGSPTNYKKRPVWQTSGKGAAGRESPLRCSNERRRGYVVEAYVTEAITGIRNMPQQASCAAEHMARNGLHMGRHLLDHESPI
jgi:hypothetical protein